MKKLTILSLIFVFGISAYAQNRVETTTKTENVAVDYTTHYTSSLWSNWYLQGSFGGAMLLGEDDGELSFSDRVRPAFTFAIGKQFTSVLGIRLGVDGNRLKGWNDGKDGIYPNHNTDPREAYLASKGVNTTKGYTQDIKYYALNVDLMVDLLNLFSKEKRNDRKWDLEGYVGMSALTTIDRKGIDENTAFGARAGLVTTYNITKRIGVNFEIGGTLTSETFDGHTEGSEFDGLCQAKLGLKWRIGKQGYKATHFISESQYAALSNYATVIKSEQMEKGQPQEQIVVIPAKMDKVLIPYVVFHDGKATFNKELQMVNISNVAKLMETNPEYKLEIVGNTNSTKAEIAEERANKVKEILIKRYSIDANKLTVTTKDMGISSQTVHFVNK